MFFLFSETRSGKLWIQLPSIFIYVKSEQILREHRQFQSFERHAKSKVCSPSFIQHQRGKTCHPCIYRPEQDFDRKLHTWKFISCQCRGTKDYLIWTTYTIMAADTTYVSFLCNLKFDLFKYYNSEYWSKIENHFVEKSAAVQENHWFSVPFPKIWWYPFLILILH